MVFEKREWYCYEEEEEESSMVVGRGGGVRLGEERKE